MGLRWDANIGSLTDQTNNRAIKVLQQIDHPRAVAIAGDPKKLTRSTPSWTEFQPRLGFAYDAMGDGSLVIRGGYGIFFDQLVVNHVIFSQIMSGQEFYGQLLGFTNSDVGVGELPNVRYGIDSLPAVPPFDSSQLPPGFFGWITDPDARDPYVQKFSIGVGKRLSRDWSVSADFVHNRGYKEPRVQQINPQIRPVCDATFPGSNPADPRCVNGANTRFFDQAFVEAGLGAGRLGQIDLIATPTNSSRFSSLATTLKGSVGRTTLSWSYILSDSRAWGGQPVASYSGLGDSVTPEQQFQPEDWGPTYNDERHRIVANTLTDLPMGFQVSSIIQLASSRPYTPGVGFDINGDGMVNLFDRLCEGVSLDAVFQVRGDLPAIQALNPNGCTPARINSQRKGFVVNADGSVEERSGRFFNVDLRFSKSFQLFEYGTLKLFGDFYNLFNTENLSFTQFSFSKGSSATSIDFLQPVALYGPGFGPPVGRPFTASVGARFDF